MSSEPAPCSAGGSGLLRGNRTRSYGSLVRSPLSPVRQGRIEHQVQPGETLQGLALKYGVSMEQIKRANRLYTNDSIFLKKSLSIPVLRDTDSLKNGVEMDISISQSKQAAAKNIKEGDKGFAVVEQFQPRRASASQITESRSSASSPRTHQRAMLGAVPLTITKRTKKLKDREDEIFEL
ncbi:hypothetical protein AGOR_G00209800 [Albula goreensis]|uniref:LysM and putative peptidoglycan-binding domain-containing protein 1 n=1 Tax=Albula goreensis TaxID=1534307 RepID=A0A8T3CNN7_9TELE|nr:hypothetical protein AGOR_G00209800 [Albula goreensis]